MDNTNTNKEYTPERLDALIAEVRAEGVDEEALKDALAADLRGMLDDMVSYWTTDKGITGPHLIEVWQTVSTIADSRAEQLKALQSQFNKLDS